MAFRRNGCYAVYTEVTQPVGINWADLLEISDSEVNEQREDNQLNDGAIDLTQCTSRLEAQGHYRCQRQTNHDDNYEANMQMNEENERLRTHIHAMNTRHYHETIVWEEKEKQMLDRIAYLESDEYLRRFVTLGNSSHDVRAGQENILNKCTNRHSQVIDIVTQNQAQPRTAQCRNTYGDYNQELLHSSRSAIKPVGQDMRAPSGNNNTASQHGFAHPNYDALAYNQVGYINQHRNIPIPCTDQSYQMPRHIKSNSLESAHNATPTAKPLLTHVDPPTFSGRNDTKSAYDFIQDLRKYQQVTSTPNNAMLHDVIPYAMKDDAYTWYYIEQLLYPIRTYDQFVLRFRKKFQNSNNNGHPKSKAILQHPTFNSSDYVNECSKRNSQEENVTTHNHTQQRLDNSKRKQANFKHEVIQSSRSPEKTVGQDMRAPTKNITPINQVFAYQDHYVVAYKEDKNKQQGKNDKCQRTCSRSNSLANDTSRSNSVESLEFCLNCHKISHMIVDCPHLKESGNGQNPGLERQ